MTRRAANALRGGLVALVVASTAAAAAAGPEAELTATSNEAVFALLDDLAGDDTQQRIAAALALRELGPEAWPAVPALVALLGDPVLGVRKSAAGALGGIGPAAGDAVPALAAALEDEHRFMRSWAAMALSEMGPAARGATPHLIHLLEGDRANLRGRAWAATALPNVDAPAELAVPALLRALGADESEEVRSVAILSLERYAAERALVGVSEAWVAALGDPHWKVRGNAACALGDFAAPANWVVAPLVSALQDGAPYVRGCAVRALGSLGATDAASEVERLLDDDDPHTRGEAERAAERLRMSSRD